jgi:hypothetical protein
VPFTSLENGPVCSAMSSAVCAVCAGSCDVGGKCCCQCWIGRWSTATSATTIKDLIIPR